MWTHSVFIITGAASGIGRELAIQAAQQGADVIALDVNAEGLAEISSHSEKIRTRILDVGKADEIRAFADETIPTLEGRKLVLVNNAGVSLMSGEFRHTSLEDIEWLMNINFWGVVRLTKAFYTYMLKQDSGHIVNVSSVFGLAGIYHQCAYSPSKFAVRGFTETLRMELINTNVRTHSVHPGGIDTAIVKNGRFTGAMSRDTEMHIRNFRRMAKTTPQEAARVIMDGITRNKARILIGKDARMMDRFVRLFPVKYTSIFWKQISRSWASKENA